MRDILLLNASEEILKVIDWKRAIVLLFTGKAEAPYNYEHNYEIHTSSGVFELPAAIQLTEYVRVPYRTARPSRRNIMKRDKNICQYCSCDLNTNNASIDHVIPRSRGGKHEWTNVVASCKKCNTKKGSRTPSEANMKLLNEPVKLDSCSTHDVKNKDVWRRWSVQVA